MSIDDFEYRHLFARCRDAGDGGISALSAGEQVAAALVLNRPEWLMQMGYTMAEAVERIGLIWCSMLLQVQRSLRLSQTVLEAVADRPQFSSGSNLP